MADNNSAAFSIIFKTIADNTGITAMKENLESLNGKIETLGHTLNQALSLVGLSLGIEKLNEFGNKALEARGQLAVFSQQIAGGIGGSTQLVAKLNEFNEGLASSLAILPETSRAMEQLFSRAGVPAEKLQGLTKGVIEFAASSAGTIQPLELAQLVSTRLARATDETNVAFARLGLKAKDLDGVIAELNKKGGDSREAFVAATGGAERFKVEMSEAQEAVGRFVNLFRVPFIEGFSNGLKTSKESLDGLSQSADGFGFKIFAAMRIAGDSITGLFTRGSLLFSEFFSMAQATGGAIAQFVLTAVSAVVGGIGTLITTAISGIDQLALHAADLARDLSHGLIDIKVNVGGDDSDKAKVNDFFDGIKKQLSDLGEAAGKTAEDARNNVDRIVGQIGQGKPSLLNALFGDQQSLDQLKKSYADFINFNAGKGVPPGSRTSAIGSGGADKASAEKAAEEALVQTKYQLAAAQGVYEAEMEKTQALEDSGVISVEQADERRRASITTYIAKLDQLQSILPKIIALEESLGDSKAVAELRLLGLEMDKVKIKAEADLGNTTFFGKIHSQLTQLKNDWSDLGKQIGGFLTQQFTAFANTAGQVISGLIFRTTSWKDAILQLGSSFVAQLATMVIQWVLARTVISALNKAFGASDAALTARQGQAAAAAWAPAATAASIASYGAAAGAGLAAYLAAIGIGTAGTIAAAGAGGVGFASGGLTPGFSTFATVGEEGPEFVFSAPAVRNLGAGLLDNLHRVGVASPSTGAASGGASSAVVARGGKTVVHNFLYMDFNKMMRDYHRSDANVKNIVQISNSRGGHLRI